MIRTHQRKNTYNEPKIEHFSDSIPYPLTELYGLPIVASNQNELIYLYFPKEQSDYLKIVLKPEEGLLVFKEKEIMLYLREYIYDYLIKMFQSVQLDKRIEKSYEKEMITIHPSYSLAVEMGDKFKTKPIIDKKLKNFRVVKKEILKNLNINEGKVIETDPFTFLNRPAKNKQLLPKWGLSFIDDSEKIKEYKSDDEDEEELKKLEERAQKNKNSKPSYKEIIKNIFSKKFNDFRKDLVGYCLEKDKKFKDNSFEKFICYIEFFVTLFSRIKVKYYTDELGLLALDFYTSAKMIMNIAETFHYQVQFRIMGLSTYHQYNPEKKKMELVKVKGKSKEKLRKQEFIDINNIQYEEYDMEKIDYFPPFTSFIKALSDKFRRYDSYDNYHLCEKCGNTNTYKQTYNLECSSCFRSIDKSRLIASMLHSICDFDYIEKMIKRSKNNVQKIFKSVLLLQNQEEIKRYAKYKTVIRTYISPLSSIETNRLNKIYRNVFGEEIGFYYTWISHYIRWLLFPAIFGVIVHFGNTFFYFFGVTQTSTNFLILNLSFAAMVILWGNYYVYSWHSLQGFYSTIWGMDTFKIERSNLYDDNYAKTSFINFLGVKLPMMSTMEKITRMSLSYTIVIISTIISICVNLLVFYLQNPKLYENYTSPLVSPELQKFHRGYGLYIAPIVLFFCREIMSNIYKKISKWVTNIEKPINKDEYNESVIKKRICFEFFNYYFNMFYIAFFKKYFEICAFLDCYLELGNQLMIILSSDMVSIATKFFYKAFYLRQKTKTFEKKIKEKYMDEVNSSKKYIYYTREEFDDGDIQSLMMPIVFNFGYIILFGACCPLSFAFMLILVLFIRLANGISMTKLLYVKTMGDSRGIGVFNKMQGFLAQIGLISNLCVIFFTNKNFAFMDLVSKLLYLIIIENLIFFALNLVYTSQKPFWYRFKEFVEVKYLKYFGIRPKNIKEKFEQKTVKKIIG